MHIFVSKKVDYSFMALLYIAKQGENRTVTIDEISRENNMPRSFLASILKELTVAGILHSRKGPQGGYHLAKEPTEISFRDVIEAIEGPIVMNECTSNNNRCPNKSCEFTCFWSELEGKMKEHLTDITIQSVLSKANAEESAREMSQPMARMD